MTGCGLCPLRGASPDISLGDQSEKPLETASAFSVAAN
uniref:Uncharacterized protein n=1 Tax=Anguilla anguilla TaxID=7936 RepID=A0A0E9WAF5_ANGAN